VWRKDGREIVYLNEYQGKSYVWSIAVVGPKMYSVPKPLFPVRMPASTFGDLNFLTVTKDGSRFYMPQAVKQIDPDVMHIRVGGTK
jgi:Tol biopolymer transport system component